MQLQDRMQTVMGETTGDRRLAFPLRERPDEERSSHYVANISSQEKKLSLAGGAVALTAGLLRGKTSGLLMAGGGAALLYRGLTGHCHLYESLGINTAEHSTATAVPAQQGYRVERAVTIARPASEYNPPGGKAAAVIAKIFGSGFQQQVAAGLARFKSEMEAGEVPTTEGQPSGRH